MLGLMIDEASSNSVLFDFGAPQGSIIGPEDYKMYTLPVGDITRKHQLQFHSYAEDSDYYVSFNLKEADLNVPCKNRRRIVGNQGMDDEQ